MSAVIPMSSTLPGDIVLVQGTGFISWWIRLGQRLRYPATYRWTHVALAVGGDAVVEAVLTDVRANHLARFTQPYRIVDTHRTTSQRNSAMAFVDQRVGREYDVLTIVALFCQLVTGWKFFFAIDGSFTCSGLVAAALEQAGVDFGEDSERITPAFLAEYYGVKEA